MTVLLIMYSFCCFFWIASFLAMTATRIVITRNEAIQKSYKTILSILKKLMEIPELQSFNLVGGTALALKYGHRTSIDLDLFITEKFDHQQVIEGLRKTFGDLFVCDADFSMCI